MQYCVVGRGKMGRIYERLLKPKYIVDPYIKSEGILSSLEDFLALKADCDLVIVASPTEHHYAQAKMLLEAGYHVLVEKPICLRAREASVLEELAAQKSLGLFQSCVERFNPVVKYLKSNLDLTKVVSVESLRSGTAPQRCHDEGPLYDLGIHDLDLWLFLFNGLVPLSLEAKYGVPERILKLTLANGEEIRCDLLNRTVSRHAEITEFGDLESNPILEMVHEIRATGGLAPRPWQKAISILEENRGKTSLHLNPSV